MGVLEWRPGLFSYRLNRTNKFGLVTWPGGQTASGKKGEEQKPGCLGLNKALAAGGVVVQEQVGTAIKGG